MSEPIESEAGPDPLHRRWPFVGLVLAAAGGVLLYKFLTHRHLEQTSALFIGLPAVLALIVAFTPRTKSATGTILKTMTFFLLLSGIVLQEGFICILMAAPLFYLVGLAVGIVVDRGRQRRRRMGITMPILLLPILPLAFEGVTPGWSLNRDETVSVVRHVSASPAEVERTLAGTPRFDRPLPAYLRLRFPRPVAASGSGLEPGDLRVIHFAGGEGHPGDLVLRVSAGAPGSATFDPVSDTSKIAHWLDWRRTEVRWSADAAGGTQVRWTIHYIRRLDPAWYFGPWERYAVRCAASYLVDSAASPRHGPER